MARGGLALTGIVAAGLVLDPGALIVGKAPFGQPIRVAQKDSTFVPDSNLMEPRNGFLCGNLRGLTMKVDERGRWYNHGHHDVGIPGGAG